MKRSEVHLNQIKLNSSPQCKKVVSDTGRYNLLALAGGYKEDNKRFNFLSGGRGRQKEIEPMIPLCSPPPPHLPVVNYHPPKQIHVFHSVLTRALEMSDLSFNLE